MSRPASPRLPLRLLAVEAQASTIDILAQQIGVSRSTVHRWIIHGIPADQADRAAIAIGAHPAYLWPDQWYTLG